MEKPDLNIFGKAQSIAGLAPEDTWMIGDRLDNDVSTP